jgi:hypothetical protein
VADLLIAPYLPITSEARVGPWVLVPARAVLEGDTVPDEFRRVVRRLIEAYQVHDAMAALGAVLVRDGHEATAPIDRSVVSTLRLALLAGVISGNPLMATSEDGRDPNAGHATATAENALLFGHPLVDGDSYALEVGVLVRTTSLRTAASDQPLHKIEAPVELPRPMFARFDAELATAALRLMTTRDMVGRRFSRALEWYRLALSNSEAVSVPVRVEGARAALEVLTGSGDASKRLVRAYGSLVRTPDTIETTYDDVFWAKGPVQLTPDEWWMTRLCDLRNAIVHGDEIPGDLWIHDGAHQLNQIHDRLITAMRFFIAENFGDELLRLTPSDRIFPRLAEGIQADTADTGGADNGEAAGNPGG